MRMPATMAPQAEAWRAAYNRTDGVLSRMEGLIHALSILRQNHPALENPEPDTTAIIEVLGALEDGLPELRELRSAEYAAGHAPTVGTTETPILELYREFRRLTALIPPLDEVGTDDQVDVLYAPRDEIEARMMALPCTRAADFAAKMIVDTVKGEVFQDWKTGPIWTEARRLVGEAGPA